MKSSRSLTSVNALLMLAAVILPFGVPHAEVYKWVDEDGNTHYTQTPPPADIKGTRIKPSSGTESDEVVGDIRQRLQKLEKSREESEKAERERERRQERIELYKKNCRIAQERLNKLQTAPQVRAVDEDGNVTRLSVEEQQKRIAEVEKDIEKYCHSSPFPEESQQKQATPD